MSCVSRLETHYDWILKELAAGKNYTQIALDLSANGVQTSRVNLVKWLNLRKTRIEIRITQATPFMNKSVLLPEIASKFSKPDILDKLETDNLEKCKQTIPNLVPSSSLRKSEKTVSDTFFDNLIHKVDQESDSPFGRIKK